VTLSAHATLFDPRFRSAVSALNRRIALGGLGSADRARAYSVIYGAIISQATTLAFMDVFALLAVLAALMFLLSFTLKKNQVGAAHAAVE
jgi:hypothetical protein